MRGSQASADLVNLRVAAIDQDVVPDMKYSAGRVDSQTYVTLCDQSCVWLARAVPSMRAMRAHLDWSVPASVPYEGSIWYLTRGGCIGHGRPCSWRLAGSVTGAVVLPA